MKRGMIVFLKLAIFVIGTLVLALSIFWLPWVAERSAEMHPEYAYLRFPVLIGLYVTVIPFMAALYQGFKLLGYIQRKNAFSEAAVQSLNHIKYYAIAISIIYIFGALGLYSLNALHPGVLLMGIAIIFASSVISLFSALLKELLNSALQLKLENDLTV
ncbi:DUF2975 domain-containing protein [Bacillus horti]|uniref:DUF2975 domain-containing protein n=1 Tax=Caldalkalibacillus horti TaxID=77523 RepID=A0ABT9W4M2_9BACI|nr:DUF2975 domain-containing protein [Bacillus horti]MDQ0168192.1 hypothetical protein [Bacillus horti]